MPGLVLGIRHVERSAVRGLSQRWSAIVKDAMLGAAQDWHDKVFPKHFGPQNRSEYNFEPRNRFYAQVIKPALGEGIGRFRDLVLSGKSQRFMQVFARVTGSARKVAVRMQPPAWFTNPFIGSFQDPRTGKTKHVGRQPDKPDEVTRFSQADRNSVREFVAARLKAALAASQPQEHSLEVH